MMLLVFSTSIVIVAAAVVPIIALAMMVWIGWRDEDRPGH